MMAPICRAAPDRARNLFGLFFFCGSFTRHYFMTIFHLASCIENCSWLNRKFSSGNLSSITAELFNESSSLAKRIPLKEPSISALAHSILPIIEPDLPITTFPVVFTVPSNLPSTLKSDSEVTSPLIKVVPRFCC